MPEPRALLPSDCAAQCPDPPACNLVGLARSLPAYLRAATMGEPAGTTVANAFPFFLVVPDKLHACSCTVSRAIASPDPRLLAVGNDRAASVCSAAGSGLDP